MGDEPQIEQLGVRGPVVMALFLDAGRRDVLDGACPEYSSTTSCAISATENDSVNWLKTRYSPGSAGLSRASSTQARVSRMLSMPRVCPPVPYTVSGSPETAWTQKRLRTVPNTLS